MRSKKVLAGDCETDPFLKGRIPRPFIWGLYDGRQFNTWTDTTAFVSHIASRKIILYMHNGGKFDFMYLLPYVQHTKAQVINGRIVSMFLGECELRDSYSAIPESLKNIKKDEIDYWKLEREHRNDHIDEITSYLYGDCRYLWELMTTYRGIAGNRTTIAGNALAFAKKIGVKIPKTNHRFDAWMRQWFFGGRTECFQFGTHHNFSILDIHSAYPYAMLHDHAIGSNFHWHDNLNALSEDQIKRAFIRLECTSDGAFAKRRKEKRDEDGNLQYEGGLFFPHEYNVFNVTGWEYLVALEFGLIRDVKIHTVGWTDATINFSAYVDHWYKYKNNHSAKDASGNRIHPNEYTTGKYMMNSLYGKLSQNPARYFDYMIVPGGTTLDREHGWQLGPEFEGHEIHMRNSLWKYKNDLGVEWKAKTIYNNVATGASITGFTRAHLLRAQCMIGRHHIIYCDTDSLFCKEGAPIDVLPCTDQLGDWEIEDRCAPVGHFAGKKLYGVITSKIDKKTGKNIQKIASKGSKLAYEQIERIIKGETVEWASDAPSFSLRSGKIPSFQREMSPVDTDKLFVRRRIRATAQKP